MLFLSVCADAVISGAFNSEFSEIMDSPESRLFLQKHSSVPSVLSYEHIHEEMLEDIFPS